MTAPRQLEMSNDAGDVQTVTVGEGQSNAGEISALLANGYDFAEGSAAEEIALLTIDDSGEQAVELIPAGNVRSYISAMHNATGQRPMVVTGDRGAQEYITNTRRDLERAARVEGLGESWQGAALGLASGALSPWLMAARLSDDATGGGRSNNFFTALSEVSEARPGMQIAGNLAMMMASGGAAGIQGLSVGASGLAARGAAQVGMRAGRSRLLQLGAGMATEEALWAADAISLEMMRENPTLSGEALLGGALFGASVGLLVGPHLRAFRRARSADEAHLFPGAEGMSIVDMARNPPMHEIPVVPLDPQRSSVADLIPHLPYISTREQRLLGAPRFPRARGRYEQLMARVTNDRLRAREYLNALPNEAFSFYNNPAIIEFLRIPEVGPENVGAHIMTEAELRAVPREVMDLTERIARGDAPEAFSAAENALREAEPDLVQRVLQHREGVRSADQSESVLSIAHGAARHMEDVVTRFTSAVEAFGFVEGRPGAAYEQLVDQVPRIRGVAGATQEPGIAIIRQLRDGLDDAAIQLHRAAQGSELGAARDLEAARDAVDRASHRLLARTKPDMDIRAQLFTRGRGREVDPDSIIGLTQRGVSKKTGPEDMLVRTHREAFDLWRGLSSLAPESPVLSGVRNAIRDVLSGTASYDALLGEGILRARTTVSGNAAFDGLVDAIEAGRPLTPEQEMLRGQQAERINQVLENRRRAAPGGRPNLFGEEASTQFRDISSVYEAGHNALQQLEADFAFKDLGFSGRNLVKRYEEDLVHSPAPFSDPLQARRTQDNIQALEEATATAEEYAPGMIPGVPTNRISPAEMARFEGLMAARGQHRQLVNRTKPDVLGIAGNLMVAQTAGGLLGSLTGMSSLGWMMGGAFAITALTLKQMDLSPGRFLLYQGKMRHSLRQYVGRLEAGGARVKERLESRSRLAVRTERYVRRPGRSLGFRILTSDVPREDRAEEYNILRERLVNLYNDPAMMAQELEMSFAPMERVNPNVAAAMRATAIQGAYYLAANMPPPEYDPLVAGRVAVRPNMAEIDSFVARFRAIQDPLSILDDLASGTLRHESAESVRMVYPNIMADITSTVAMVVQDMGDDVQHIPYQTRVNMDLLVGSPTDTTLTGGFIELMQNRFAQTPQQSQAQGMSRATPRSIRIASSYLTEGQALGQRN